MTVDEGKFSDRIRLACVGDSITGGGGTKDPSREAYPAQLGALLGPKWDVRNFGRAGATLLRRGMQPYIKQLEYAKAIEFKPDVVVIMLGTADSIPMNWINHRGEFESDYESLIDSFGSLETRPRIFLCRPTPAFPPSNFKISEAVLCDEIGPAIDRVARKRGLVVIDLHSPFFGRGNLVPDHIHPDAEGSALIAECVYRSLTGKTPPARN